MLQVICSKINWQSIADIFSIIINVVVVIIIIIIIIVVVVCSLQKYILLLAGF